MKNCVRAAYRYMARISCLIEPLIILLKALEALVLRCPSEITPFLGSIIQVGNQYIKYDPVSPLPLSVSSATSYKYALELCR